jgi:hypothetical protein
MKGKAIPRWLLPEIKEENLVASSKSTKGKNEETGEIFLYFTVVGLIDFEEKRRYDPSERL